MGSHSTSPGTSTHQIKPTPILTPGPKRYLTDACIVFPLLTFEYFVIGPLATLIMACFHFKVLPSALDIYLNPADEHLPRMM
jgi:hypothetical protein